MASLRLGGFGGPLRRLAGRLVRRESLRGVRLLRSLARHAFLLGVGRAEAVVADRVVVLMHRVVVAKFALEELAFLMEAGVLLLDGLRTRILNLTRLVIARRCGDILSSGLRDRRWLGAVGLEVVIASLLCLLILLVSHDAEHLLNILVLLEAFGAAARVHDTDTQFVLVSAEVTPPVVLAHLARLFLCFLSRSLDRVRRLPVPEALVKDTLRDLLYLQRLKVFARLNVAIAADTPALWIVDDVGPAALVTQPHRQLWLRLSRLSAVLAC